MHSNIGKTLHIRQHQYPIHYTHLIKCTMLTNLTKVIIIHNNTNSTLITGVNCLKVWARVYELSLFLRVWVSSFKYARQAFIFCAGCFFYFRHHDVVAPSVGLFGVSSGGSCSFSAVAFLFPFDGSFYWDSFRVSFFLIIFRYLWLSVWDS